jgi:hypothetical protein
MANLGWTAESNDNVGVCENVSIGANEDGRLEIYTYSPNDFNIYHKWQEFGAQQQNIIGFSNWASFPHSGDYTYQNNVESHNTDIFVGLTAIGDSCIQIVTQGAWGIAQTSKNGNWPGHLSRLGAGPSNRTMITAMARSATGVLYAFGVDQGTLNINYATQPKEGGAWSWHTINHPKAGAYAVRVDDWPFRSHFARTSTAALGVGGDFDGRIEMFYGSPLGVWTISQTAPGVDNWSEGQFPVFQGYTNSADWTVIQNDPTSGGDVAGRLELFALALTAAGTYTLFHCWQTLQNGTKGWSAWQPIPGLAISLLPTQDAEHLFLKGPIRAARQQDGSIVIFAIGNDGCLHYIQQNGANAAFRENWVNLGAESITAFDIGQNIDGTLFAVINSGQQIWRRQQVQINSDNWGPDV